MLFGDIIFGIGQSVLAWVIAAVLGNVSLPALNGNETVIYREHVPVELQGRVFSIRSALQFGTIPVGYILGGLLADYVFEPIMAGSSGLKKLFSLFVGTGAGSGMAVMFIISGFIGTVLCIVFLKNRNIRSLDQSCSRFNES
jgi:hypothetical protein